jgi:hypothetical protein
MKARASCPFTSRSGPIPDTPTAARSWPRSPNWTAYGMRGAAPATPLVCRRPPPGPPAKGRAGSARDGSDERRRMRTKSRCKTRTLVRDRRGIHGGRRSFVPTRTTKDTDLQVLYGSDGTRTRDLRRDRPARRNRLQPATPRNHGARAGISLPTEPAPTGYDRPRPGRACVVRV